MPILGNCPCCGSIFIPQTTIGTVCWKEGIGCHGFEVGMTIFRIEIKGKTDMLADWNSILNLLLTEYVGYVSYRNCKYQQ
jgi:hypothetical protein